MSGVQVGETILDCAPGRRRHQAIFIPAGSWRNMLADL
jgi:hypothetical protein